VIHAYGILYLVESSLKLPANDWTQCRLSVAFVFSELDLIETPDSESVAFSLSDLLERFLTARNCMSLILKMKTNGESGLWLCHKITPNY
jgi:hypothetical protein